MELFLKKKEIVSILLKKKILVNKELIEKLNQPAIVEEWHKALTEKGEIPAISSSANEPSVKIVWEYNEKPKKRSVQDFIDYFNARYRAIEKMLRQRQELQNLTSMSRLKFKRDREATSVIGIILDKQTTKNENIILTLEDTTGTIKVLINKTKPEIYSIGQDLVFDEIIGVTGTPADGIIFANSIIHPDVPHVESKKTPDEAYAAVLSCIHVGSANFEHEKFDNFIKWTNGQFGDEKQKEIASKTKYIFICGDMVDGVGIYPQQEKELSITDIREQYKECARLLSQISKDKTLIMCPGNHDASRISEPQPKLSKDYAKALWELPNAVLVCNPCVLNIHSTKNFPGINVLMYHGYSFDDYGEIVPSIKNSGKHLSDRAPLIMKFLLQRRHLAPQHTSTLYIPDAHQDPLVIEQIPDLFVAGHIHKAGTTQYRGISIISASCFQSKTEFQERVGHEPEPGVVPVINLQTRQITLVGF